LRLSPKRLIDGDANAEPTSGAAPGRPARVDPAASYRPLPVPADLDLLRLLHLGLRDPDLEDAVLDVRVHLRLVGAGRQPDRAAEGAEAALEPIAVLVRRLGRLLALRRDGQRVVVQLDRDLVLGDAGQIEGVHELVVGLPDVECRHPVLARAAVPLDQAVHEPAHLRLQRRELPEGLPANESGHPVTSFADSVTWFPGQYEI
jgi:hypothetical protein